MRFDHSDHLVLTAELVFPIYIKSNFITRLKLCRSSSGCGQGFARPH